MKSTRVQAAVLVTAAVAGYAGAAAFSALAAPALPVITDWGPGDGLTRYALTATSGSASPALLAALEDVDAGGLHQPRVVGLETQAPLGDRGLDVAVGQQHVAESREPTRSPLRANRRTAAQAPLPSRR